jgi:hypothetical protein
MLLIITVVLRTHEAVEWGIDNRHVNSCGRGKKLMINREESVRNRENRFQIWSKESIGLSAVRSLSKQFNLVLH